MKKKRIWKKIVSHILTTAMLVSIFAGVDMGWNVMEVQATDYTYKSQSDFPKGKVLNPGDTIKAPSGKKLTIYLDRVEKDSARNGSKVTIPGVPSGKCHIEVDETQAGSEVKMYLVSKAHSFTGKTVTDAYRKSVADCESPAVYYYKCAYESCTAKGTSTYTSGSALGHDWSNKDGVCKRDDSHTCSHSEQTGKATCGICGMPLHTHGNFEYTASNNQLTATCKNTGCTDPAENKSITIEQAGGPYNGSAYEATIDDGLSDFNTWTGQTISASDIVYEKDGATIEGAPVNAGDYTAKLTVGEAVAKKEFSITKIAPVVGDFTYTAPSSLVYDREAKTATVTSEKTGMGTITVKYYDSSDDELSSAPVNIGTYKIKITVTEGTNYNAVTEPMEVGTFTISRADYGGTKDASGTLKLVNGKTTEITLPGIPEDATYGSITNSNTSYFTVGEVTDGKVVVTSIKNGYSDTDDGDKIFTVAVDASASNYNNYDITVTITPAFHVHNFTYSVPDSAKNTIEAECDNADGDCFLPNHKVILRLTANNATYDGNAYTGASVYGTAWEAAKLAVPTVMYEGTDSKGMSYGPNSTAPTNAGEYTATVTVTVGGTDYVAKKDFEIDKATQDNAAVNYLEYKWGETNPVPRPTMSGVEEDDEATVKYYYNRIKSNVVGGEDWDGLTNETLDAGTFYVYAELGETSNYKAGKTPAREFKVIGQEVADGVIETSPYDEVYDKEPHSIELTINDLNPEEYTVTYSTSEEGTYSATKPEFTDAGSYTVYYKVKKFGFEVAKGSDTVDIAKKDITISGVKANDKVYNGNTTATFTYSDVSYAGIIEGDTLSVEATGTFDTKDVGTGTDKTVNITGYTLSGTDSKNYKLAESGHQSEATAKITQREVTLAWDTDSFDYNGSDQKPAATAGNLIGTDTCDVTVDLVGATESKNAGNYTAKATELSNSNYKLPAANTQAFTINKIAQSGTLTMTGYTYGETVSVPEVAGYNEEPTIKYYYSLEDKKTGGTLWNNVGPTTLEPDTYYMYAVLETTTNYKAYTTDTVSFTVTGMDMSDDVSAGNNEVTYTGAKEHGITVTAPNDATVMYGTVEGNYTLSTCPTYKNVGEYTVYYKVTKTGCNPVKKSAKVIINKATLIVTPNAGQTKVYGDEDPVFTYTVSQLKAGDTASVVSGTLKRVAGEDVSDAGYELSMNTDMTATNYEITCTTGVKFMITPRDITDDMVTISKWKFDTTPADVTGYITVKYGDTVLAEGTAYELSGTTSASAKGTYTVTITGKGNFKGSVDKEWKITDPIVSGISATSPVTITYGDVPSISITGTLPGDTITYGKSMETITDSAIDYKDAGTYTVYYKVAREGYEPFESSVQLVIEPKEVTITWGNTDLVYNGKTQAPTATVNGLVGTDTCQAVISSDAKNVGTGYEAITTSLSNANYKLPATLPTTTFSIKAKPITVKAKNVSKYTGDADPKLGYDAQGLCAGDTLSGVTLSRASGEKVGTYTITVTVNASSNPNYDITTQNGTFTINNRPPKQEDPKEDDPGSPSDSKPSNPSEPVAPVIPPVNKETPKEDTPKLELPVIIKGDDTKKKDDEKLIPPIAEEKEDADSGNIHLYVEVHENAPIEEARIETSVNDLLRDSNIFTEGELEAIKSGMDAKIWTTVHEMDMSLVTDEEQDKILFAAIEVEGDDVNLMYFDINMFKQIGEGEIIKISEPGTHIEITIDLPESVINTDENMVREYKIIRLHDGEVTVLDTVFNDEEKTLTFATDKFSTYVLAYVDKEKVLTDAETVTKDNDVISPSTEPEATGHSFAWIWWLLIIVLLCMVSGYVVYRKKTETKE